MEITSKDTQAGAASPALGSRRQIGQYQVTAKLGEGGMGEVFRAHDAKLDRDVALKILPAAMAHDSQSLARLAREARTLASLNHPNIAVIYGLEESEGLRALVMELIEGQTLAEQIRGRAGASSKTLSSDESLPVARQIAEALEYAHERGVIHRDLKPANVKITPEGTVKVLDFGLAKVVSDQDSTAQVVPANSPTISVLATQAGIILGTAAYMAPEQAKGKQVDRRADIWAFGCVLFEMLSGEKAFDGETISDVLASVLKSEPDWTALPSDTPPAIKRLIRRCLVKDPKQRLRDIGDARIAIEETLSGVGAETEATVGGSPVAERGRRSLLRRALPWALGASTVVCAAVAEWLVLEPKPQQNVVRFSVSPPENAEFLSGGETSLSPDGRTLAFVARSATENNPVLWLRRLDSLTASPVPGTEGAFGPFWSPDGQQIGFEAGGKLEKIPASGGTPQTLCDANGVGATWNREGVILFENQGSLYRVPDTGGTPALVLSPDAARHEAAYRLPQFLPDGRHFLFEVVILGSQPSVTGAGSLDSKSTEIVGQIASNVLYAPPGYLFYLDGATLMARPFNARAKRFTGPAVPLAQYVGVSPGSAYGYFSVSPAGVLAFQIMPGSTTNQLAWFSRTGQRLGAVGETNIFTNPALSPDGARLAAGVGPHGDRDIWIFDLKRGTASRLTLSPADDLDPVWSLDGTQVFFSSNRAGQLDIYQQAANGLGSAQPVFQSKDQGKYIDDLSSDGRYAIYDTGSGPNGTQLWALPLFGDRKPVIFVQGSFGAHSARFSPNGRYVAYDSNETGRNEIYVQTFPEHTGKWQVSASGGVEPMWRHDGKELFYLTPDNQLTAVSVNADSATFQAGIPKPLFQAQSVPVSTWRNIYVASPDGQRFLMLMSASQAKPEPITVVVNWPALLKK